MRVLRLEYLAPFVLCGLILAAGCAEEDGDTQGTIVDLVVPELEIEQPGAEHEQIVQIAMHRQGDWAKHSFALRVSLFAEASDPVERVSVGALLPASAQDRFRAADSEHDEITGGLLELAPCPGRHPCTSTFSSAVRSSAPAPARMVVNLLGSAVVPDQWETSEHLQVELGLAP